MRKMNREPKRHFLACSLLIAVLLFLGVNHYPANAHRSLRPNSVLTWNTFLGAASADCANAIAVDADGNVYLAGTSNVTWGSPIRPHAGGNDAFVAKLKSDGTLVWHTFLGGIYNDSGNSIVVDAAGNVYLVGTSEYGWSDVSGLPRNLGFGLGNAFVVKLDRDGKIVWYTFQAFDITPNTYNFGNAVAVDKGGNVFIAGYMKNLMPESYNNPLCNSGFAPVAFAAKLNGNGDRIWVTYMGAEGNDYGNAIAVDDDGDVYVAGESSASWEYVNNTGGTCSAIAPLDRKVPVMAHAGDYDAFVTRLNGETGAYQWHTFLGFLRKDYGKALVMGDAGNLYLAGHIWSYFSPYESGAFIASLDKDTGEYQWHSYLESSTDTVIKDLAVDDAGNIYLAGDSPASWGAPDHVHTGGSDAFVAKLDKNGGIREWHSFLGSAGSDTGNGVAVDSAGNVYLAGTSDATWDDPLTSHAGDRDAFVAKLSTSAPASSGGGCFITTMGE